MKYLLSLGIVLFSVPLSASEIILEQVTLRRGMEGDTRQSGALDDPKTYSKNKVYREEKDPAAKAGVEIDQFLDDYYAKGFRKESGKSSTLPDILQFNPGTAVQEGIFDPAGKANQDILSRK
ncbi:hypothetical protein [Mesorhizobium sp.]|uniref:hypothetical protein n=1 Tax=Mesorhizobium sp. TaxID=1871066 RepID=UPI00257AA5DD|nr:hypothetical protein [Mesorhizobium sp.]